MSDRPYSRRDFLLRLGLAGAAVPIVGACSRERSPTSASEAAAAPFMPANPADPEAASCPGLDELTEEELAARRRLRYVDRSTKDGQFCDNCVLVVDERRYRPCKGCRALPGPVAPRGWCTAWVAAGG